MSAENSKYSKVRQDIVSHEKTVKEQVDKYFKELLNKLDQSHETVLTSVKSDINAISLFTNKTEDKINEVQDFIDISNASEFFKEVKTMEKSTEIQEPQTKPSYSSSPKFVPGNITQSHIGSLQDDGNLSAEINISLVINNEYQTELDAIAFISLIKCLSLEKFLQCASQYNWYPNIGDSLDYSNGQAFTTKDRDNFPVGKNCAIRRQGAWWYKHCAESNLNGVYREGIEWYHWKKNSHSMKSSSMMIRRL
ncbi:TN [Mytilus edulis]|uniref:TN n=1 Tax=Mytilus edulis TaxID=6550 RepID=A0A8S3V170_MYTED|nr:TN [Mytilus edulis]